MDSTKVSKKAMKAMVLIAGAAMTMGNQKCEEKASARSLKKIVDMGSIRSSPLVLPSTTFDFQFVANEQIYDVLINSDKFALRYAPTISAPPSTASSGADVSIYNLSSNDRNQLRSFANAAGKQNAELKYSKTAWCMVNVGQTKVSGVINSFEVVGGGGIKVGFNPQGSYSTSGLTSGYMKADFAQLDLSLRASRPLSSSLLASANVTSKESKTKLGVTLNLGQFVVGADAYYSTPLASVTKAALKKAVDKLGTTLDAEPWYTRVMANHDTHLVIVGGTDVGLMPGDELLVYNEDYYWEGEPCNSKYLGGGSSSTSAVAKIQIDWVGDEISRGKIVEQNSQNAVIGAKVKLYQYRPATYVETDPGVGGGVIVNAAR